MYENRRAYVDCDLEWAWRSFISFRAIRMQVIYICTAQQFTRFQLARPRRAVPQRQLGFLFDLQRHVLLNSEWYLCRCPRQKNAAFLSEVTIWWIGRWRCNLVLGSIGSEYAVRVVYCIILSKMWLISYTESLSSVFYCTVCKQSDALNFETWQIVGGEGQFAIASPHSRLWGDSSPRGWCPCAQATSCWNNPARLREISFAAVKSVIVCMRLCWLV